jgi:hypothetical protein
MRPCSLFVRFVATTVIVMTALLDARAETRRSPDAGDRADTGTAFSRISRILKRKGVTSIPSTSKYRQQFHFDE